jgi:phospholipase C
VAPPCGAIPPDHDAGEFGFDFTRFGLRVPAVLVSPLIAPDTVFRVPAGVSPASGKTGPAPVTDAALAS